MSFDEWGSIRGTPWHRHILVFLLGMHFSLVSTWITSTPSSSLHWKVNFNRAQFLTLVSFSVFSSQVMYVSNKTFIKMYDYYSFCSLYIVNYMRTKIDLSLYLRSVKTSYSLWWGLRHRCRRIENRVMKKNKVVLNFGLGYFFRAIKKAR